jgi:hypothetical protein
MYVKKEFGVKYLPMARIVRKEGTREYGDDFRLVEKSPGKSECDSYVEALGVLANYMTRVLAFNRGAIDKDHVHVKVMEVKTTTERDFVLNRSFSADEWRQMGLLEKALTAAFGEEAVPTGEQLLGKPMTVKKPTVQAQANAAEMRGNYVGSPGPIPGTDGGGGGASDNPPPGHCFECASYNELVRIKGQGCKLVGINCVECKRPYGSGDLRPKGTAQGGPGAASGTSVGGGGASRPSQTSSASSVSASSVGHIQHKLLTTQEPISATVLMTKEDATDLIQRAVKEAIDAADRSKAKGADQDPIQRLDDWKKVNDKNTAKCWEIDSSVFSVGLTVSIIFVPDGSVRTVQIRKSDNTLSEAVALVLDEYKNQTLSNN